MNVWYINSCRYFRDLVSSSPDYSVNRALIFTCSKGRLVLDAVDGVTTLEEGRELVSRAAENISLSPDYSIGHAFDFNLTKKGWYLR